jgi:hypothetical protein
MRLVEIKRKYFNMMDGAAVLIEGYTNPESELVAEFEARLSDKDTFYYKCNITEKGTGDVVLFLDFFLDRNNPNSVTIDNIYPAPSKVDPTKVVHTTLGQQNTGVDVGHIGIKWVYRKIKEFAKNNGFDIKKIVSTNRYTGARAKNNPSVGDEPGKFNVNMPVKETLIYDCASDTIVYGT